VRTIEALDGRLVGPVVEFAATLDEPVTIALLPDHATPCALRTHVHDPVPFLICRPGEAADGIQEYNEESCRRGSYGLLAGDGFFKALLRR
jgi:2,3-bisphosphoglycerate-independent phosphoglycerate mutase